jgi:hypothetical protein
MFSGSASTRSIIIYLLLTGPANRMVVAQSYTPEHPQVVAMVDRGIKYLSQPKSEDLMGMYYELGAPLLSAYAVLKVTGDTDHPTVQAGIEVALEVSRSLRQSLDRSGESKIVYEAAVSALLLATADSQRYQAELQAIRDWYVQIQKPHGGFGYLGKPTGDTSQVQYSLLALWSMQQAEIPIPLDTIEAALKYLRATQDPSGGWGYQGVLGTGQVPQDGVTKSLSTAGAGAIIMAGDILGFYGMRKNKANQQDGIPEAFVRIDLQQKEKFQRGRVTLSRSDSDRAIEGAVRYLDGMANVTQIPLWYFYWRYSQERYESFREIFEGKQSASPDWYNQGVRDLMQLQDADGSWGTMKRRDHSPPSISTSFAILFLIRSTQRAIGQLDEGIMAGGYGLPQNVASVQRVGNSIVGSEELSIQNLLEMLESDDAANVHAAMISEDFSLSQDPKVRADQVVRIARLLNSQEWQARRVAAKLLGRSDDITQAPELIYALTDNDPIVPVLAEESLRLLSRRITQRYLDTDANAEQKKYAFEQWKKWYLSIFPEYTFLTN